MSKKGVGREARQRAQRATDLIPLPKRPLRDSAIFYGILAACLVGVTYATGGGLVRAIVVAVGFFLVATAFSWWRFRVKLAERARKEAEEGR
jgi:Flp pilus assembly protein TadB